MDCMHLQDCPFFNGKMSGQHGIGAIYKKKFCKGNSQNCARYRVIREAGEEYVPANLYPNMQDIAQEIIEKTKKT